MKGEVWGITIICNEQDIIGYTLSHMIAQGVDKILVYNNASTDKTNDILSDISARYPGRIVVRYDEELPFYQGRKFTAMAYEVYTAGAEWVIPFDADELFYCFNLVTNIADAIRPIPDHNVLGIPMWNHYCTSRDEVNDNPFKRMVWRHPNQNPLDKTIIRWQPGMEICDGNHLVKYNGQTIPGQPCGIGIRHFSARSADLFVSKSVTAAIRLSMTDLPVDIGAHVRMYAKTVSDYGPEVLKEHYYRYFFFDKPDDTMVWDPANYSGDL